MYKIPKNYNIYELKGETVYQVAFGINFITLFFSKGFIQIEGSFSTIFENETCDFCEVYPVKHDFSLLKLLERTIIEVDINSDRNVLVLLFESGFTLKLTGNEEYESYKIKINEEEIII